MTIVIPNVGQFEIPNEKAQELIEWLQRNSVKLNENKNEQRFDGTQLING